MERPREKPAKARKLTPAEVAAYKEQQDRRSDPRRVKFCYDEDCVADVQITPGGGSAGLHSAEDEKIDWEYDDTEILNQSRWTPPGKGEPARLLSRKEAAERTGMKERWIELSIAAPFPDPDGRVGSTMGWLESTLDKWSWMRPSRGARREPVHFMTRTEVAAYMGLKDKGLTGIAMPPPDAVMGSRRVGWLPATIDTWNAQRPGRGRYPRSS